MSMDAPQSNKMMTSAPAKKGYHFAGSGIWHAQYILANSIEEAEKIWHETKELLRPDATIAIEQDAASASVVEDEKPEEEIKNNNE